MCILNKEWDCKFNLVGIWTDYYLCYWKEYRIHWQQISLIDRQKEKPTKPSPRETNILLTDQYLFFLFEFHWKKSSISWQLNNAKSSLGCNKLWEKICEKKKSGVFVNTRLKSHFLFIFPSLYLSKEFSRIWLVVERTVNLFSLWRP